MEGVCRLGWVLALLACAATFAGTPHLVRNINETTTAVSSDPTDFIDQGSWSLFNAATGSGLQLRLFATDGTSAGTFPLASKDPMPSATGYQTTKAGRLTFWSSTGTGPGSALWVSDGTSAGTRLVMDFGSTGSTGLYGAVPVGDVLYFPFYELSVGKESLWRSDGTPAGTYRVTSSNGPYLVGGLSVLTVGQKLYFLMFAADNRMELWSGDGTPTGNSKVGSLSDSAPETSAYQQQLVRAGGYLLFAANSNTYGRELVRYELSSGATSRVADIAPGSASGVSTDVPMVSLGNVALFGASTSGGSSYQLWRSDGTAVGTYSLGAIAQVGSTLPNYSGIVPTYHLQPGGAKAYFLADDGSTVKQLYVSDGTIAGTLRLSSGPADAYPLANPGSSFYFGSAGIVMRTDGTLAGTQPAAAIQNIAADIFSLDITGNGTTDFVRVRDGSLHYSVYRYDVSSGALTLLTAYSKASLPSTPVVFAYARGTLFFDGEDPVHGHEPWVSDGTAAGTHMLLNVAQELGNPSSPSDFTELNGQLFFFADDGINGRELWTSDGTHDGTKLAVDINAGSDGSNPMGLFAAGGALYFFAQAPTGFYKFWKSDGTPAGTHPLAAISPVQSACGPGVAIGNTVFFPAGDSQGGVELWKTDGTSVGTVRVADIYPGSASAVPCELTVVNGRLFFAANDGSNQGLTSLWTSDGTGPGTLRIGTGMLAPHALTSYNGLLYFMAVDSSSNEELWRSDGTSSGTVAVTQASSLGTYALSGSLIPFGSKLLFSWLTPPFYTAEVWSYDGAHTTLLTSTAFLTDQVPLVSDGSHAYFAAPPTGQTSQAQFGPWVTDGTAAGTMPLWNVSSPFPGNKPFQFYNFNGLALFQDIATDGSAELWRTDGSPAGTRLIGNIGAAARSSYPVTHLVVGNNFFYASDDGVTGMELFALDNAVPLAADDSGGSVTAGSTLSLNVLQNDVDPDGTLDVTSIEFVTQPNGGSVSTDPSGTVTYSAKVGFSGADSFTYTVADTQGGRSRPATVRVTVVAAGGSGSSGSNSGTGGDGSSPPSKSGGGGSVGGIEVALLAIGCVLSRSRRRRHDSETRFTPSDR